MEKIIPELSEKEYKFICYCWENIGIGSLVKGALGLSNEEFARMANKLQKEDLIEKGDYPVNRINTTPVVDKFQPIIERLQNRNSIKKGNSSSIKIEEQSANKTQTPTIDEAWNYNYYITPKGRKIGTHYNKIYEFPDL